MVFSRPSLKEFLYGGVYPGTGGLVECQGRCRLQKEVIVSSLFTLAGRSFQFPELRTNYGERVVVEGLEFSSAAGVEAWNDSKGA